jgi:uncharacterized protein YodC (DUF2158 family)
MKYLCMLLLALAALCSITDVSANSSRAAATTTTGTLRASAATSSSSTHRQVQADPNYEPWANGTPVYWEFPGEGWWKGIIVHYSTHNGEYTIEWEDGSIDYFDNYDEVNQMVAYAQNDPSIGAATDAPTEDSTEDVTGEVGTFPIGTPVGEKENGVWYVGTITNYSSGMYTVRWAGSDGETERFSSGPTLTQMVADADTAAKAVASAGVTVTSAPTMVPVDTVDPKLWEPGTPVAEFEEGQWWFGIIKGFNGKAYFIRWDDREVEEISDMDLVNQMVADAETQASKSDEEMKDRGGKYPIGTPVYDVSDTDGSVWTGVVESYYHGNYAIRWMDGSVDTYREGPKMDEMVADATRQSEVGMKPAGKAFLILFIIVLIAGGAFVGLVFYKKKQLRESLDKNAALEEPREDNVVTYRDEPADDTPKII